MAILRIGTDIVETLRIAKMIERHGELFINRVYTSFEIDYCSARKAATQHYAGRWAAKEAVLKALGTGWRQGISWRDVEVRNIEGGAPVVALRGGAREVLEESGIVRMHISISHCRNYATACAVAEGELPKAKDPLDDLLGLSDYEGDDAEEDGTDESYSDGDDFEAPFDFDDF